MQLARKFLLTALCLIPGACSSAIDNESTAASSEAATTCKNPTSGMAITANTTLCAGTFAMNTPPGSAAITIGADNVTVTCNQTILQGPGASGATASPNVGFNVVGRKTVTLKGCTAKGFQYGAVVKNSSSVTLDTMHLDDNFTDPAAGWVQDGEQGGGIRVENTTSSTVKNSTFTRNWNGIELRSSSSITVTGNTGNQTNNVGALIVASNNNTVTNNDFSYAIRGTYDFGSITFDSAGILLDAGSSGNLIQGNNARNGGDGIFLRTIIGPCATNNRIIGNDASMSPNNGIESWCDNNVFSNNTANNCNYGIWLGASDYLTVTGNTAAYNNTDGISIQGGSDRHGLIQDNILQNNVNAGLFLAGAHNAQRDPLQLEPTAGSAQHLHCQRKLRHLHRMDTRLGHGEQQPHAVQSSGGTRKHGLHRHDWQFQQCHRAHAANRSLGKPARNRGDEHAHHLRCVRLETVSLGRNTGVSLAHSSSG